MTATKHTAGKFASQNTPKSKEEGSFCTRVSVTEGTKPQSRSRLVSMGPEIDQHQPGNIHRNSVSEFQQADLNHQPFSSIHRPEPTDLPALKRHQQDMLSKKSKRSNKRKGS